MNQQSTISSKAQIFSGMRISVLILLGFVGFLMLLDGERRIVSRLSQSIFRDIIIGGFELLVVVVALWLTVQSWSAAVPVVAFLTVLKGTIALIAGTTLTPPYQTISRWEAAEGVASLILIGILSLKFVTRRPKGLEKVALMLLPFAIGANMLWETSPAVIGGVVLLAFARLISRSHTRATL